MLDQLPPELVVAVAVRTRDFRAIASLSACSRFTLRCAVTARDMLAAELMRVVDTPAQSAPFRSKPPHSISLLSGGGVEDVRHGWTVAWWTAQKNTVASRCYYRYGRRHGRHERFFVNGQRRDKRNFDRGVPVGKHSEYYTNGVRKSVVHYTSTGELTGTHSYWTVEGALCLSTDYVGNQRHGWSRHYAKSRAGESRMISCIQYNCGVFAGNRLTWSPEPPHHVTALTHTYANGHRVTAAFDSKTGHPTAITYTDETHNVVGVLRQWAHSGSHRPTMTQLDVYVSGARDPDIRVDIHNNRVSAIELCASRVVLTWTPERTGWSRSNLRQITSGSNDTVLFSRDAKHNACVHVEWDSATNRRDKKKRLDQLVVDAGALESDGGVLDVAFQLHDMLGSVITHRPMPFYNSIEHDAWRPQHTEPARQLDALVRAFIQDGPRLWQLASGKSAFERCCESARRDSDARSGRSRKRPFSAV